MQVNIWSSGYDGTRMKKKNVVEKKWMMDMAWYCMRFRRIFRDLSPVSN